MEKMSSVQVRTAFLEFFSQRGHQCVPSSPLVPWNDPTLLFTNAGMVQFKDTFLGHERRDYSRAVSSQRCVRAGGKHNDLENVGYTARHHTFFEMLGNFSFGDYFKAEAIRYAWGFLTDGLKIPPEKLWITIYKDDDETAALWLDKMGVDPNRFSRLGEASNFWSMGDIGPCGPCTEIFYDHGEGVPGGPPGSPDEDGDRYIELWNLVFMQYERSASGELSDLPRPSVDTGMGLERIAAVMQGVHNNYDIDLFRNLLTSAAKIAGTDDLSNNSLRVIADHIRSCSFLIIDGVLPSNEGRGYVLRRIIRRAIRHGYQLGIEGNFFHQLVAPLAVEMGEAFPELVKNRQHVEKALLQEEKRFAETLGQGMKILENCMSGLVGKEIPGETVFQLYDTYGFPVDLTADFAREHGLGIDSAGFETAMEAQRQRARAASRFRTEEGLETGVDDQTEFVGYDHLVVQARVLSVIRDGSPVESLGQGQAGAVVLDRTPFYAESGGQVGDKGCISTSAGHFLVSETVKQGEGIYIHYGQIESGSIDIGEGCGAEVDAPTRQATALNHSATHLVHAALRSVLGKHVTQKGSLVDADKLRFDFSHFQPMTSEEMTRVEEMVNEQIQCNASVSVDIMGRDDAMNAGAMALFGEKYGDRVRVLKIGDFSTELCGGTHVSRAGDIGYFKLLSETGVAAGVRRIEAVTGRQAVIWGAESGGLLEEISAALKGDRGSVMGQVQQLLDRNRQLEKKVEQLRDKLASSVGGDLSSQAVDVGGVKVLAARLDGVDSKWLRNTMDQLKNKLGSAAIVLATVNGEKVSLIAGVTRDKTDQIRAGDLVNVVAARVGGRGGGRPDMAQAGGNLPGELNAALDSVSDWVREQLG
ncbi:MAG: alanine--tRNA ligase [Methylococcales bacterium]|nr:alanine--tRNA ligase [Methylococcales bacterium]